MDIQEKKISVQGKRKGVLTVEAAIILPVFLMVMFFVLSIMKLFYFHLVMQQALHNVGRTLAQYGYVIDDLVGLEKFTMSEKTKEAEGKIKNSADALIGSSQSFIAEIEEGFVPGKLADIVEIGNEFKTNLDNLIQAIKGAANKEIIINYLIASAMNEAGGEFVRWMVGDYLDNMQASNGTIKNLEYSLYVDARSGSSGEVNGTKDIILLVDYDYSLPFFFFDKVRIRQAVRVHPWVGGTEEGIKWE